MTITMHFQKLVLLALAQLLVKSVVSDSQTIDITSVELSKEIYKFTKNRDIFPE